MAIAYSTHYSVYAAASTNTIPIPVGGTVAVGSFIIVTGVWATVARTVSSITDSQSNTYASSVASNTNTGIVIASTKVTTQLTSSDTVTINLSGNSTKRLGDLFIVTGLDTTTWLDKFVATSGATAQTMDSGATATTTTADEIVVGVWGGGTNNKNTSTFADGNGHSGTIVSDVNVASAGLLNGANGYVIVSSTEAAHAVFTTAANAGSWDCAVATFAQAAAAPSGTTSVGFIPI